MQWPWQLVACLVHIRPNWHPWSPFGTLICPFSRNDTVRFADDLGDMYGFSLQWSGDPDIYHQCGTAPDAGRDSAEISSCRCWQTFLTRPFRVLWSPPRVSERASVFRALGVVYGRYRIWRHLAKSRATQARTRQREPPRETRGSQKRSSSSSSRRYCRCCYHSYWWWSDSKARWRFYRQLRWCTRASTGALNPCRSPGRPVWTSGYPDCNEYQRRAVLFPWLDQ